MWRTFTLRKPGCRMPRFTRFMVPTMPWARTGYGRSTPWCMSPSLFTNCWPASARPARCWCKIRKPSSLTSTSPQYSIIASCDVAAAMMEPPGGTALVEESIAEALDFRRAMRKVDEEYGDDWWFKVWGPDKLVDEGVGKPADWMLKANEKWHGFGKIAAGFNMLD